MLHKPHTLDCMCGVEPVIRLCSGRRGDDSVALVLADRLKVHPSLLGTFPMVSPSTACFLPGFIINPVPRYGVKGFFAEGKSIRLKCSSVGILL